MIYKIYYCLMHGDCSFHSVGEFPLDPCNTRNACICEHIANYDTERDIILRVSHIHSLEKYFDDANDGYTLDHHLIPALTCLKMENLNIGR